MGKVIVITGVTKGLGRALAEWYISHGHTVVGCGRSAEVLNLRLTHPSPNDFTAVDVTEETRVAIWSEKVLGTHGAPDFLINNAALMNNPAPLWKVPANEFNKLIDVNIKGVANVLRHFVPAMVAKKKGVIVNFSSGWGRGTSPEVAPYCASKFAIEGLTQALAQELPAGMAAVPLNPGVIDTAMLRQCWNDQAASYPKADEWAETAAPFILKLSAKDNGKSRSVEAFED
ncbi:SDR family oxidoreductase [Oleiharenicola lentus]|uniref:SDR family oxidoreductase n=1 Tax=Oleiharenicola lentus TaxID=2508720 RepID=UPI003F67447E